MLTDERIEQLTAERAETPNIMAPDWAGRWQDGGKGLFVAVARILILARLGQKPNADGLLIYAGEAAASEGRLKASPLVWRMVKHDCEELVSVLVRWGEGGLTMRRMKAAFETAGQLLPILEGAGA